MAKAAMYDERPKMKRDARLKAVFSPRKRLLSVGRLSSFSGVCHTLRLYSKKFIPQIMAELAVLVSW